MMSQNNIPVHDYTPALDDVVRLGDADLFLYHGLGLEPWVDETLEGLGSEAPDSAMVHTMPTGEISLDYEINASRQTVCSSLSEPSAEVIHMLAEHAEDAEELHGDDGAQQLAFPKMTTMRIMMRTMAKTTMMRIVTKTTATMVMTMMNMTTENTTC